MFSSTIGTMKRWAIAAVQKLTKAMPTSIRPIAINRPVHVAVVKTAVRPPSYGKPRGFTWPSLHSHTDPHAPRAGGGNVGP